MISSQKYHDCRDKRLYGIYFLARLMLHVKVWPISYLSDVRGLVGYISLLSISFSSNCCELNCIIDI